MSIAFLLLAAGAASPLPRHPQTDEPRVIEIVARRFAFEPARVEAAVGEHLRLVVRSADGVHGIEIGAFKVKREIPRGAKGVVVDFTASKAGEFPILCSEYCGNGHDEMTGLLVVSAGGIKEEGHQHDEDADTR